MSQTDPAEGSGAGVEDVTAEDVLLAPDAAGLEDVDPDAPEADVVDQRRGLVTRDDPLRGEADDATLDREADPADVEEQARAVDLDEDDYR